MANLTHPMITSMYASCSSVEYFHRAVTFSWSIEYNKKISSASGTKSDENMYTCTDIDNIFQDIVSTGILDNVNTSQA